MYKIYKFGGKIHLISKVDNESIRTLNSKCAILNAILQQTQFAFCLTR